MYRFDFISKMFQWEWMMKTLSYFVYILADQDDELIVIGATSHLEDKVRCYKECTGQKFYKCYQNIKLVYYETFADQRQALIRSRQLQSWKQNCQRMLIGKRNPEWRDLYTSLPRAVGRQTTKTS